jgi:hypothetical protein
MNELELADEVLGIVSNLSDADDALEYARLYLEAQTEAVKHQSGEYEFDTSEVYRLIASVDSRFDSAVRE